MSFEERLLVELKAHLVERAGAEADTVAGSGADARAGSGGGAEAGGASARRRRIGGRVVAGIGLLGAAAVAAVAVPLLTGTQTSAYALTRNPDGTIRVQINELRDPDRLEADLRAQGVAADIAYLPEGKKCAADADPAPGDQVGQLSTADDDRTEGGAHGVTTPGDEPGEGAAGTPQERRGVSDQVTTGAGPRRGDEDGGPGGPDDKVTHRHEAEAGGGAPETESFGAGDAKPAVEPKSANVFLMSPESLKPGHTVVLRLTENKDKTSYSLRWWVTEGPVAPCKVVAG
ncbi:hypothetical protein AB0K60_22110 [Thermopolyspora sp. NPDC052614]|uniref:hypothetical protein n=1 Tax=Thermopolyspora sp. NPDC052614 TaxID=3155682 RepID=UPI00342108B1